MANKSQRSIVKLLPHPKTAEHLKSQLKKHGGMKIVGFGVFKVSKMPARKKAFNPYSKKYQKSESYYKIKFTPTKKLKEAVQK